MVVYKTYLDDGYKIVPLNQNLNSMHELNIKCFVAKQKHPVKLNARSLRKLRTRLHPSVKTTAITKMFSALNTRDMANSAGASMRKDTRKRGQELMVMRCHPVAVEVRVLTIFLVCNHS